MVAWLHSKQFQGSQIEVLWSAASNKCIVSSFRGFASWIHNNLLPIRPLSWLFSHPPIRLIGIHGLFIKWNGLVYGSALVNHLVRMWVTDLHWSPITCKLSGWPNSWEVICDFVRDLQNPRGKLRSYIPTCLTTPPKPDHADKVSHQRLSRYIGTCHVHLNRTP